MMSIQTTVRHFLANYAIRIAITADDIVGVDWSSANFSTPSNAEGITAPALAMAMTCHYLVEYGDTVARTFDYLDSWLKQTDRF